MVTERQKIVILKPPGKLMKTSVAVISYKFTFTVAEFHHRSLAGSFP